MPAATQAHSRLVGQVQWQSAMQRRYVLLLQATLPYSCRSDNAVLEELFNRDDACLVVFSGQQALVTPVSSPESGHAAKSALLPEQQQQGSAATPDVQTTWQQPDLKWRPAYLQVSSWHDIWTSACILTVICAWQDCKSTSMPTYPDHERSC